MPSTIIERYKRILNGQQKRFSPYEFEDIQYRKKKIQLVLRYAIEHVRQWTPEQARERLSIKDVKELKLHLVREYIEPPVEAKPNDVYYLVEYAYPYLPRPTEEQKVMWVYQEVLAGVRRHFPPHYFQSVKGEERARICFDHLWKNILNIQDERMLPQIFSKTEQAYRILRTYKLKILVDTLYFSPYDLITELYPALADPALWMEEAVEIEIG
ncbi:hypothetical protein LOK74_21615 [Brevibacillus humidisoli]|uniref:hypothetical protein n=1 Tax=Brevibacillus humidisoli TaxID=2895522 RepID=UPI001E4CD3E3|nr:hypothetical protein [Brevibacillus humidisoli]UFJ40585.1 hypothetical protein LOK74_21615 [Brevibacillus humidisoli]